MNLLKKFAILSAVSVGLHCGAAFAGPPGGGDRVYGPDVEKGKAEVEFRGSRLTGGEDGGEGVFVYETSYGVTNFWKTGAVIETENEPNAPLKVEAFEIENIFALPRLPGVPVDLGIYAEYEASTRGADEVKLRGLAAFNTGPVATKLNFNVDRSFASGAEWELGYGFLSTAKVFDDVAIGIEGFGEFGAVNDFGDLKNREHYIGPALLFDLEPKWLPGELEVEADYLFGVGAAEAEGQARLLLEWEFRL